MLTAANLGRLMAYSSISLLIGGTVILIVKRYLFAQLLFSGYLLTLFYLEFFSKKLSLAVNHNNLILFSVSSFIHFSFITWIYLHRFYKIAAWKVLLINLMGQLPLLISSWDIRNVTSFQSYDRLFHNLTIICYALYLVYAYLKYNNFSRAQLRLNAAVMLFFSIDFLLALGTNFLINQHLQLVYWFWIIRGVTLQLFYLSLIYYIWNNGKNP